MKCLLPTAIAAISLLSCIPARADLTAYFTLDNLTGGILNLGTDGSTSDLSAPNAGATPTVVPVGLIGGALSFDGNDILTAIVAGNAADDLLNFPFAMSVWMRLSVVDTTRDTVMTISQRALGSTYWGVGTDPNVGGGRSEPELTRRNTAFTETNATGTTSTGSTWLNVVAVFGTSTAEIYVNGKLAGSAGAGAAFSSGVDTLSVGGFLRNGSTAAPTDPYTGQADDVGLFDTSLLAADAALINGLGLTGSIGLDQLDEAQALNAMLTGTTALIGGTMWEKASGLAGVLGDYGGTVSGGNAFIVTDNSGGGLRTVPEPASMTLLLCGLIGVAMRRRR